MKTFAIAAAAMLTAQSAGAQPQSTAGQDLIDYTIFSESGFSIDAVHQLLAVERGIPGEIKQLSDGSRYGVYTTTSGLKVTVEPDFCQTGQCLGLVFRAFFVGSDFNASLAELNRFNVNRPHGNATQNATRSNYIVQRIMVNISGVTRGAVVAEFNVFDGYSDTFFNYLREVTAAKNTAAANPPIALETPGITPDSSILSAAADEPLGPARTNAETTLEELRALGEADAVLNRWEGGER